LGMICPSWLWTMILLICASWIAGIIGVNWHLYFSKIDNLFPDPTHLAGNELSTGHAWVGSRILGIFLAPNIMGLRICPSIYIGCHWCSDSANTDLCWNSRLHCFLTMLAHRRLLFLCLAFSNFHTI
jgi:hypothetical protein